MTDRPDTDGHDDELDDDTPGPAYDPAVALYEFEGQRVTGLRTSVGATTVDGGAVLHHGQHIVTITVAQVDDIRHPRKDGHVTRLQVAKPTEVFLLDDGEYSESLLRSLRLRARQADDAAAGRGAFSVTTDENGIVLTPGDQRPADLPDVPQMGPDEVVVILEDQSRHLWPDDFAPDASAPVLGEPVDEEDERRVIELLDVVSGESLGTWSPADDAAADVEVVAELEGQRLRRRAEEIVSMTQGPAMTAIEAADSVDLLGEVAALEENGRNRTGIAKAVRERLAELESEPF